MPTESVRNKTLHLTPKEISKISAQAVKLSRKSDLSAVLDKVIWQDAFRALSFLPDKCVDLMIVDPPFNLTKNFSILHQS